jgi:hypothetical protein
MHNHIAKLVRGVETKLHGSRTVTKLTFKKDAVRKDSMCACLPISGSIFVGFRPGRYYG